MSEAEQEGQLNEHDQAMVDAVDKAEGQLTQETNTDEENVLLAGKYKSVEDLEKAYGELQTKLGQEKQEEAPVREEERKEEDTPPAPTTDEAKETLESKGLDFDAFYDEYVENGELSPETYESLEKANLSKEVVNSYIEGRNAIQQQQVDTLQAQVGGEANYKAMIEWAGSALTEGEQQAFNTTLDNVESAKFAIQGLYAQFKSANPNLIGSDRTSGTVSAVRGYATKSEMMEAMSSPKYKMDHTYRAEVQRKVGLSTFL